MIRQLGVTAVLVFAAVLMSIAAPAPAAAQTGLFEGQNIASDTYYRLDPNAGVITVRLEARVQNATSAPAPSVFFMLMPGARDLAVSMNGQALDPALFSDIISEVPELAELLGLDELTWDVATVTPERPLVPNIEYRFVLEYTLGATRNELMSIEPGAIEAAFVSQGPGSFTYIDLPSDGDNYLDPGCLLFANQPAALAAEGYERWICGETTLIALSTDTPSVLAECAAAAPRCRQLVPTAYAAFAQTVTDPSLQGTLEAVVEMDTGPVAMTFQFFKRDQEWARRQFDVAQRALPLLEDTFGFAYPYPTILLRESNYISIIGAAGVAFSGTGTVLLSPGDATTADWDESVTIHELAHQWSSRNKHFSQPWVSEGLAEYSSRRVAKEMGIATDLFIVWKEFGVDLPLSSWYRDIPFGQYWYGRAGDFWFEYEAAVGGPAAMTQVLALVGTSEESYPLLDRWFHDRGEELFSVSLDSLFLGWVYNPVTAEPVLATRRATWAHVDDLVYRALTLGLPGVPAGVRPSLDRWAFGAAESDIDAANAVLDYYAGVLAAASAGGLPRADATIQQAWMGSPLHELESLMRLKQHAIDALAEANASLSGDDVPESSRAQLQQAIDLYENGAFEQAATAANRAVNLVQITAEAGAMLEAARGAQAQFGNNIFERIGLIGSDPAGDLEAAETALVGGSPERTIQLAHSARTSWEGAQAAGALRLAITAGVVCILIALVYMSGILGRRKPKQHVEAAPAAAKGTRASSISPDFQAFLDGQRAAKQAGESMERPASSSRRPAPHDGVTGRKSGRDQPPGGGTVEPNRERG